MALFAVMLTVEDIGLNCDEPKYYNSCRQQAAWFSQAAGDFKAGRWSAPFAAEVIDRHWNYQLIYNVHPPFYKLCSTLTLALFENRLGTVGAYRLSPAVMFSLLVALLFWTVGRRYGIAAGIWAAGGFALMPRIFGHAHFGCTDMPLTLLWFASAASFHRALDSKRWALVFALVYGLALATKFTAFIIPLPLAAYVLLSRRFSKSAWPLGIALVISPLIMIGLNPQWWHGTLERLYIYLVDSATRSEYLCIPTYYLGSQYYFYLPWHHPLVLTLFTVQPLILAGLIYGLWRIARRPFGDLWASHMLIHWLALIVVMMLPSSPGHDGVRLFLPSFAFLAVVSAIGFKHFNSRCLPWFHNLLSRAGQRILAVSGKWVLLGLMLAPSIAALARVHPYELCYYNRLAGGIRGANNLGMETTYMWDNFNSQACKLIDDTLPDSAGVFTMNNSHYLFLQGLGQIKPSLRFNSEEYDYILQYNRQGMFTDMDWTLFQLGNPVAEFEIEGVRLFALYRYPEVFGEILAALDSSESHESFYRKAVIYQLSGRQEDAIQELERYLKHRPRDFDASIRMAELLLEKNISDRAIYYLRQIKNIEKDPKQWHYYMGLAWMGSGEKKSAGESFRKSLESRSRHSSPLLIDADIYYRMGNLEEAVRQYELVLRTHRSDEIACRMLGLLNHELGNIETAGIYYQKLLEINSGHFETLYNLGLIEIQEGETQEAERYFSLAFASDSTNAAVNFQLANILTESGDNDRAVRHYRIILAYYPNDIQAHSGLANIFLQDPAKPAEALEHFRTLARLQPDQAAFIEEHYIKSLKTKLAELPGKLP
ncbi:tetratricopeptide repeat protein [Gemmatimonadota bacterium]